MSRSTPTPTSSKYKGLSSDYHAEHPHTSSQHRHSDDPTLSSGSPNLLTSDVDPIKLYSFFICNMSYMIQRFSNPENCTASLILHQMSKHNDYEDGHKGLFVYLVNKLYEVNPEEIEFYMPQLLNIFVNKCRDKRSILERYMLTQCAKSLHFGIRLSWYVDSEISQQNIISMGRGVDAQAASKQHQRMVEFRNLVEEVTVNQKLPKLYEQDGRIDAKSEQSEADYMDAFVNKQRRLTYFNDEHSFLRFLTDLSSRLRDHPLGSVRAQRMRVELENVNQFIPNGVYVPCCWMYEHHYRIVRIVAGECNVFSTKERVPYLVTVESIRSPFNVSSPVISFTQENSHVLQETTEMLRNKQQKSKSELKNATSSFTGGMDPVEKRNKERQHDNRDILKLIAEKGENAEDPSSLLALVDENELEERRKKREEFDKDFEAMEKRDLEARFSEEERKRIEQLADRNALLYACFGESSNERSERIRQISPFGHLEGWAVQSFIVKANDDMRQEHFAMQLIDLCKRIFDKEQVPLYIKSYHVIVTDRDSGLMECLVDSTSLHALKKKFPNFTSLYNYFTIIYGPPESQAFKQAQHNFIESMAGYSVICYILQIKDRHNGNIMIHRDGHVVHIDFGFFLGNSPGAIMFENAPFKLTAEFVELMGGVNSATFKEYSMLVHLGLKCMAKHKQQILSLVEMMGNQKFPCFEAIGVNTVLKELNARFKSDLGEREFAKWANSLIDESLRSWRTKQYDNFQKLTNGIMV